MYTNVIDEDKSQVDMNDPMEEVAIETNDTDNVETTTVMSSEENEIKSGGIPLDIFKTQYHI